MRKRNQRGVASGITSRAPRSIPARSIPARSIPARSIPARSIPGRALAPFLLFWCLGSFALGQELARLPLATFASAVARPLQSAVATQGALAPTTHARQIATGLLGGKPTAQTGRKTSGKATHGKTKRASRFGRATYQRYAGQTPLWTSKLADARGQWGSRAQWVADSTWVLQVRWSVQWAGADRVVLAAPDPLAAQWGTAASDDDW